MNIFPHKKSVVCFSILSFVLAGCSTISALVGLGAQIAGDVGVIDKNMANAIANSSKAVGNAAEEISPEQEYYIGRAVAANIITAFDVWEESPYNTVYANYICQAVVAHSPKPEIYNGYRVAILDSYEINAFASPGGHIFITKGLFNIVQSEEELAAVIAHEVAHIQLQHSIKAIKTSRITQALMVTGVSAAGAAAGYDVNEVTNIFNETVGDILQTLVNSGYSQTQEFDADAAAMSLLAGAGYNPEGLLNMLVELEKGQKGKSGGFAKTHPSPAKRIEAAKKAFSKVSFKEDSSEYRKARFAKRDIF